VCAQQAEIHHVPLHESDPVWRPVGKERLTDDPGSADRPPEAAVVRFATVVSIMKYSPEGILMVPEKLQITAVRQGSM
jgi:hypothetical protein